MSTHAQLSPSSAVRWMSCPGSVALCKDLPDTSSPHADEGTAAHFLASECLEGGQDAITRVGATILVSRKRVEWLTEGWEAGKGATAFVVDADMALAVQDYLNYVRDLVRTTGGTLLVEQRLSIADITGEPDAYGTSDVVILADTELIIVDLKYGRGVAVVADDNPQLQIYALAALREYGLAADFETVRMVIHQPRLGSVSEWVQTTDQMEDFAEEVAEAGYFTRHDDAMLNPTEKGCKWCKAKATCPALRAEVMALLEEVAPAVAPVDLLAQAMDKVGMVEAWCKAIRAELESKLLAGVPVQGWKLVQGKKGNRAWTDKVAAEEMLKSMRIKHDEMYDYSVISPTSADKLAKAEIIGPRQWPKVQALITQAEGRPSVAPESDKRPALVMSATADDFEDVTDSPVAAETCDLA